MPTYIFKCYDDEGGCDHTFEITCPMNEIQGLKPICPECQSCESVFRDFSGDVYVFDSAPKTVGTLAERNASRMSNDQMQEIKTKDRLKPKFTGSLPQGAKLYDGPTNKKGKDLGKPQ